MRQARENARLSVAYVADQLRRHPASVERWERGAHAPSRSCLLAMAKLYGCPVEDLL